MSPPTPNTPATTPRTTPCGSDAGCERQPALRPLRSIAGAGVLPSLLPLLLPGSLAAQERGSEHAERIERIERSLVEAIQIEGRPVARFTLRERMAHHGVPGLSVAVIDGGEVAWAKAYGVKDVRTGEPVTTGTLFQAASISKPVAAMGMLTLVEDERLDLDADVGDYLRTWTVPDHDFDETVTLRRLVSHTAGLTVHGFPGYPRSEEPPTTAGVLRGEGNTAPVVVDLEPGTRFRYSGGGTTVMQQLVEDVTGEPFPVFMERAVLAPVGMTSSTYAQPLPRDRWDEAATAHRGDGSPVEGDWHVYPEMAAAGLWTTPTDLARLAVEVQRSLRGESDRVLSRESTAEMLTPVLEGYGLGFGTGTGPEARFGHGGANAGFRAVLTAFREGGGGAAIMTNSDRGGALYQELLLAIAEEYGWQGVEPRVLAMVALAPARQRALEGTYRVGGRGIEVILAATDDGLFGLTGEGIPGSTLVPVSATELVDLGDGSSVTVEWDGERVARLRSDGQEAVPVP